MTTTVVNRKISEVQNKIPDTSSLVTTTVLNLNLGVCGGCNFTTPPPSWFSLNNSKTVRAVTLECCSIQYHSIRDTRAKFGIHNFPLSPDIGQNSDGCISDFRISGQSLIKKNCHNSRTSDHIGMKLGPVTKIDKRNKIISKKIVVDVMLENCDVIVIF